MTEDEQESLAMVNEAYAFEGRCRASRFNPDLAIHRLALRAVQERKAFAQEVSDAVENTLEILGLCYSNGARNSVNEKLSHFIIAKPDPLEAVLDEIDHAAMRADECAKELRAALARHNLKIGPIND